MYKVLCILIIFTGMLTACATEVQIADPPADNLPTNSMTPTGMVTSLSTSPIPSVTPTVSTPITAAATLENSVLAESGFDIADVRISNPDGGSVGVDFKYRIDASEKDASETAVINISMPAACSGVRGNYFEAIDLTGQGQLIYRQTSQGGCELQSFDIVISFKKQYDAYNETFREVYRERIDQGFKVAGGFPIFNSRTVGVNNFTFQTTDSWSGRFRFEYAFSPDLADKIGRYQFKLKGMGDILYCEFSAAGPLINGLAGTYEINIDLRQAIAQNANGIDCLGNLAENDVLTFDQVSLSFEDGSYLQYVDIVLVFNK